jgi:hypothetical protein
MLSDADRRHLFMAYPYEPQRLRRLAPYLNRREGEEWKGACPVHEVPADKQGQNASINLKGNKWQCFSPKCKAKGNIIDLLKSMEMSGGNVVDINTGESISNVKLPSVKDIKAFHERLLASPALVQRLHDRGLTDETIDKWQIGFNNGMPRPGSYVFPVLGHDGKTYTTVRLYKRVVKKGSPKWTYWGSPGMTFLVNSQILAVENEVVICGGEWDMALNNQYGIPTLTHTGGETNWRAEWSQQFKGKTVFICYDDDAAGMDGSITAAKALEGIAEFVYIIRLDTGIDGGDITDFYIKQGHTTEDFRAIMEKVRDAGPFTTQVPVHDLPKSGKPVSLLHSQDPELMGQPIELIVQVIGKVEPAYTVPKIIKATCKQDQKNKCLMCPMKRFGGERIIETSPADKRVLQFVGMRDDDFGDRSNKVKILKQMSGAICNVVTYDITDYSSIELLQVVPSTAVRTDEAQKPINRVVYNCGTYMTPVMSDVRLVGSQVPDPASHQGALQIWHSEPVETPLDKFRMSNEIMKSLEPLQNEKGQTPLDKMMEVASNLALSTTYIYDRDLMHVAMMLVWGSALAFDFNGKREDKGWLDALVIGDTRTGKSEIAQALTRCYNAGTFTSCEGATFAGLVGGNDRILDKHFMLKWGLLPQNDCGQVTLDEMSGLSQGIIENMSSIRSSGVANIEKMQSGKTSARVRLLWLTNPVKGDLANSSGIRELKKLMPHPEDIARYDFVMAARSDEVQSSVINRKHVTGEYDDLYSGLLPNLAMWAWSRKPEQIKWVGSTTNEILKVSEELGRRYVKDPPLVQPANVRTKLARLAAAFAISTFSHDKTGEKVYVRVEHVRSAVQFLDTIYSSRAMGYAQHSETRLRNKVIARDSRNTVWEYLTENSDLCDGLQTFRDQHFKAVDLNGVDDSQDGVGIIRWLNKHKMLHHLPGNSYEMEEELIEVLKILE